MQARRAWSPSRSGQADQKLGARVAGVDGNALPRGGAEIKFWQSKEQNAVKNFHPAFRLRTFGLSALPKKYANSDHLMPAKQLD
jgi:hypothetical protein